MVPNDKTYLFIMLEGKFKVVNPKSGLKIYEFSPHKLFSAITLLVPHSVEFPGFSCQLDFSWNQFSDVEKVPFFEIQELLNLKFRLFQSSKFAKYGILWTPGNSKINYT